MQTPERFSALYFRDFRLFWIGQWISLSGTWMHLTAQGWLIYSLTKSSLYLGLVSAASSLPILLFSLFGGAVADRLEKRGLLIITQSLSIIPALMIGYLTSKGTIEVWHVMALVFMLGTINAFDIPTRQSYIISMVNRDNILNAIALNSAAFNGARMIGPVLAGIIISTLGIAACFYINAISYLATVITLFMIRTRAEGKPKDKSVLHSIGEGFAFIKGEPSVMKPILLVSIFSLFGIPFVSQMPVFAEEVFGMGAKGLGYLIGASGVGAFSAALYISFIGDVKRKRQVMGLAAVIFPVTLFAFTYATRIDVALVLMVIGGLSVVTFLATANSMVQLKTPDALRGRVMSVYTLLFLGMTPIGHMLIGVIANSVGVGLAVRLTSIVCIALSLIILMRGNK